MTDKLRIGIQLHMYQMGQFGGPNVRVDWASGDYKVSDYLGFRLQQLAQAGFSFPTTPGRKTYGGDLCWVTPWAAGHH